ncbi:MAG: polyphosphate kinase 1 [Clostridiales bacterium]|nr:polyphosphate kinase 1 [Clostridiales bacterium]
MENKENTTTVLLDEDETGDRFPLACYANRELSWLQFNERVLEEAATSDNPLCERLSFAAIFQSNLDEFFMVRVGTLHDQLPMNILENKTGMTAQEQLDAVLDKVRTDLERKDWVYSELMEQLRPQGAEMLTFSQLNEKERRYLETYFMEEVQPLLSPQIVGSKQPFPFLNGKDIYAVVSLKTKNSNERLGIIPCSNRVLRRLVTIPGEGYRYILMEDLILHFAPRIFERYRIVSKALVRILRSADISIDDAINDMDDRHEDYRRKMEKMIRTRRRLCPIKMEYHGLIDEQVIDTVCKYLDMPRKQAFPSAAPLDLSFLYQLQDDLRDKKELFYPRRTPQASPSVDRSRPMVEQIKEHDVLLSYPYESMQPFLRMLLEACHDPAVASIKMTLYRVARNSRVVDALCQAAENGKEVVVLVELRARFDEERNIEWSRVLEDAGCRIIYGLDGIKIHSKLCLITRKEGDQVSYITQFGTGNYNEKTSKQYTDLSLMTANQDMGREAAKVFNCLCMGQVVENMEHLMVAPHCLQNKLCDLIDGEIARANAGQVAYIGIKCNSLTDKVLINKLIEASQAGVKVEMVIRGIYCMVSGIPRYTDNIRVVSIVGRYLEHARIYLFGQGDEGRVYISSADFMTRNTTRRVEVAAPIYDPALKTRIRSMFQAMMNDNVKARAQQSDGTYQRPVVSGEKLNAQEYFFAQAYQAAEKAIPQHKVPAVAPAAAVPVMAPAEPVPEEPVSAAANAGPAPETPSAAHPVPVSPEPESAVETSAPAAVHPEPSPVEQPNPAQRRSVSGQSASRPTQTKEAQPSGLARLAALFGFGKKK